MRCVAASASAGAFRLRSTRMDSTFRFKMPRSVVRMLSSVPYTVAAACTSTAAKATCTAQAIRSGRRAAVAARAPIAPRFSGSPAVRVARRAPTVPAAAAAITAAAARAAPAAGLGVPPLAAVARNRPSLETGVAQ